MKRRVKVEIEFDVDSNCFDDNDSGGYQALCNIGIVNENDCINIGSLSDSLNIKNSKITSKQYIDDSISPYMAFVNSLNYCKSDDNSLILMLTSITNEFDFHARISKDDTGSDFIIAKENDIRELSLILMEIAGKNLYDLFGDNIEILPNHSTLHFTGDSLSFIDKAGKILLSCSYDKLDSNPRKFAAIIRTYIPYHPNDLRELLDKEY